MKLGEFIENFIRPNSLVRLVYKYESGNEIVLDSWDDVSMEWEILQGKGRNRHYINNEVLGITCIAGMNKYPDAINIVIERLDNQPLIDETNIINGHPSCSCNNGIIDCPGCKDADERDRLKYICAGCLGKGKVICGKCGGSGEKLSEKKYYLVRWRDGGTIKSDGTYTDIFGITTDESKCKEMQSTYCYYEKVKILK